MGQCVCHTAPFADPYTYTASPVHALRQLECNKAHGKQVVPRHGLKYSPSFVVCCTQQQWPAYCYTQAACITSL